jgi:hypothetical protein
MEWSQQGAKTFANKHGDEAMRELLVNYVITNGSRESSPLWKDFCIKLKLCTKATHGISLNMHYQAGASRPYHFIRVLNGQGRYLIQVNVLNTELQQYLGE